MSVPDNFTQGYVQVYTGNGKGKTTAALGLALRAVGAGLHVFIAQFAKGRPSSEREALLRFGDHVTIRTCGSEHFIRHAPGKHDIAKARQGLTAAKTALVSGAYRLVILDEANGAVNLGLFSIDDLLDVVRARPPAVELVITGRDAHARLIEAADLVTNMQNIKHYFEAGVPARRGIET